MKESSPGPGGKSQQGSHAGCLWTCGWVGGGRGHGGGGAGAAAATLCFFFGFCNYVVAYVHDLIQRIIDEINTE